MEFSDKLQELRKLSGLTQEQVAEKLYVSRTAVSKWEQGKGYPGIDTLKKISELFKVTVDELLSGEKILSLAEEDAKQKRCRFIDLAFGLFDISVCALLFLPFFAEKSDDIIRSVSLLNLSSVSSYVTVIYFALTAIVSVSGVLTLALQNCKIAVWLKFKSLFSLLLSLIFILVLILGLQPYAAVFLILFLIIKVLILIKK